MNRLTILQQLFKDSKLSNIFNLRSENDYPDKNYSALRFVSNDYRLRAIEIWDRRKGSFFRIYHSSKIAVEIKQSIDEVTGLIRSRRNYSDFEGDFQQVCNQLFGILESGTTIDLAKKNVVLTRNSKYEGLSLPDVDTSDQEVIGRVYTWKEIIAIDEDSAEDNQLKKALSKGGVYLQRSVDGTSRYIGSAYGQGGILSRWLKHLTSNGNAKHLNLYVLDNGYSDVVFTVLEFTGADEALEAEKKWKNVLGTLNNGPYYGYRLNSN